MKICPSCQVEYDDKFSFCNQCGSKLHEKVELVFCPYCGNRTETEGAFCPYCGKSLKDKKQSIEVSKTVNSEETELSSETKINFEKIPHNLFDKCEEIENQAVCKKSEVKYYPETDLKKIPHNYFDKLKEIEDDDILTAENIFSDKDADYTYAKWYSEKGLFYHHGRRSRLEYFKVGIITSVVYIFFLRLFPIVGGLVSLYISFTNISKRLHDINKSVTHAIVVQSIILIGEALTILNPKAGTAQRVVEQYTNTGVYDSNLYEDFMMEGVIGMIALALMFIPPIILLCIKGTDGPNRYGPDPLKIHK